MVTVLFALLTAAAPAQALRPDTVLAPPGGPRVVLVYAPGSPAAAIRASVRVLEAPGEAGAARLLQHLALRRLQGRAAALGAEFEARRTPDAAVYSVSGAVADFEHLASLIRGALAGPDPQGGDLEAARAAVLGEIERTEEAPADALYAELLHRVAPSLPPPSGTRSSVDSLSMTRLAAFWRRAFRRDSVTLVVVAPVPVEALLAALGEVGAPAADSAPPPALDLRPSPAPRRRPETLRVWYGVAYLSGSDSRALASTAARVLADVLDEEPAADAARVDLWHVRGRVALVTRGAAYPPEAPGMIRAVSGLLARARAALSAERVTSAARMVHRDLLFAARTPWGLAEVIGRLLDATDDPYAAQRFSDDVDGLDPDSLAAFLARLAGQSAVRAELRP